MSDEKVFLGKKWPSVQTQWPGAFFPRAFVMYTLAPNYIISRVSKNTPASRYLFIPIFFLLFLYSAKKTSNCKPVVFINALALVVTDPDLSMNDHPVPVAIFTCSPPFVKTFT